MSVYMNVRMYKIMRTQIKLRVRTYAAYANCQTLSMLLCEKSAWFFKCQIVFFLISSLIVAKSFSVLSLV